MLRFFCALLLASGAASSLPCQFGVSKEEYPTGCWLWDFSALPLPPAGFELNTSSCPSNCNRFVVGKACTAAPNATCAPAGLGSNSAAPAFQVSNQDGSCYSLGGLASAPSIAPLDAANATAGLVITYTGGDGGRKFSFRMVCDSDASAGASAPDVSVGVVEAPARTYTATWRSAATSAATVARRSLGALCRPMERVPPRERAARKRMTARPHLLPISKGRRLKTCLRATTRAWQRTGRCGASEMREVDRRDVSVVLYFYYSYNYALTTCDTDTAPCVHAFLMNVHYTKCTRQLAISNLVAHQSPSRISSRASPRLLVDATFTMVQHVHQRQGHVCTQLTCSREAVVEGAGGVQDAGRRPDPIRGVTTLL